MTVRRRSRGRAAVCRWLRDPAPDVEWLQRSARRQGVWAMAAQGYRSFRSMILTNPATGSRASTGWSCHILRACACDHPPCPASKALVCGIVAASSRLLPGQPSRKRSRTHRGGAFLHDDQFGDRVLPLAARRLPRHGRRHALTISKRIRRNLAPRCRWARPALELREPTASPAPRRADRHVPLWSARAISNGPIPRMVPV